MNRQKLEFLMRALKAANCHDLRNVLAGLRPVEVSVLLGETITASGGKTLAAQVTTDSQWLLLRSDCSSRRARSRA